MEPKNFVGMAPKQTEDFVNGYVSERLARYSDSEEYEISINV